MQDESAPEYCPKCQITRPTFHFTEDSRTVRRCRVCGFPVETGLILESAEALGLPSPPDIKILCVDDERMVLQMIGDILRFHGYTVLTAADGPSALQEAARERPALILLDIMMPGMDGFEVCRRLKADPLLRAIPVIILTALLDFNLNERAFEVGAELAMRKPAEPHEVLRTIEAALALAAARAAESAGGPSPQTTPLPDTPESEDREPAAQQDLAIPVRRTPLTIWTTDGGSLQAEVFLRLNIGTHAGSETVQDRLNDPERFLTLWVSTDMPLIFLNKLQMTRVELEESADGGLPDSVDTLVGVSIVPIQVQLITGEQLSGTVRIEGPSGKRRLSDFLNAESSFLCLREQHRLHFVHKRFIARIVPQTS